MYIPEIQFLTFDQSMETWIRISEITRNISDTQICHAVCPFEKFWVAKFCEAGKPSKIVATQRISEFPPQKQDWEDWETANWADWENHATGLSTTGCINEEMIVKQRILNRILSWQKPKLYE